jgi:hypothetical protein
MKQCSTFNCKKWSKKEAQKKLNQAYKAHQEFKKHTSKVQLNWKDKLGIVIAEDEGQPKQYLDSYIKSLQLIKKQKKEALQIKAMRGKLKAQQPFYCMVSDLEDMMQMKEIKLEAEHEVHGVMIDENDRRYSLAHGTRIMKKPFLSEVSVLAEKPAAQQILQGTYQCPRSMDPYM